MIETSSPIHSELYPRYSPEDAMWKTSPDSQLRLKMDDQPTQEPWSENWPRSGMTVGGTLYQRRTLAHRISENGGGLWPTPTTQEIEHPDLELDDTGRRKTLDGRTGSDARSLNLADSTRLWPTPVADGDRRTNYKQGGSSLGYAARNLLPTPSATKIWPNTANTEDLVDSEGNPWTIGKKPYDRRTGRPVTTALADVGQHFPTPMQWNTPNTMDGMAPKSQKALDHEHDTARPGRTNPNNLRDQVAVQEGLRLWPTPSSGGDSGGPHGIRGGSWAKAKLVENVGEAEAVAMSGGQLSATWVCWLMGIPLGWDSLDPLPEGAYEEWAGHMSQGTWWAEERGLPRLAEGQTDRVNRLKCLGNGVVPASGALAFITLEGE